MLHNPLALSGWLLCLCVLLWALLSLAAHARRRHALSHQFQTEHLLLEERLQLLREQRRQAFQAQRGHQPWQGFTNFRVAKKVVHGSSGICSLYLKPTDPDFVLPDYLPGQHLVFRLPVPGQDLPVTRRYSLSDRAGLGYYRISVKLALAPPDHPDAPIGLGSCYFHSTICDQSLVQAGCPAGSFHLQPRDKSPVVLIGGGVGLTPILSMFNAILEANPNRETWLFYTIRDPHENILFEEDMLHPDFPTIAADHPSLRIHLFYSQLPDDYEFEPEPSCITSHSGRLSAKAFRDLLPSNNYQYFLCGPDGMMDQLEADLSAWGVPEDEIFSERFAPTKKNKPTNSDFQASTVRFEQSDKAITVTEDDACLLDVAERAGVPIAFDCRSGSCGQCQVDVSSGSVTATNKTSFKCPAGKCLACSSLPKGDVVLDC